MGDLFKKKELMQLLEIHQKMGEEYQRLFKKVEVKLYELTNEAYLIHNKLEQQYYFKKIDLIKVTGFHGIRLLFIVHQRIKNNKKKIDKDCKNYSKKDVNIEQKKTNFRVKILEGGVLTFAGALTGPPATLAVTSALFTTATTGTSIATLSGAAANNAILAWLGGGALSIGGGGMAAGEVVLAMMGPIGAAFGLTSFIGGNIISARIKNIKNIKKINKDIENLSNEIHKINLLLDNIEILRENFTLDSEYIDKSFLEIQTYKRSFLFRTKKQKEFLKNHLKNVEIITLRIYADVDLDQGTFITQKESDNIRIFEPLITDWY